MIAGTKMRTWISGILLFAAVSASAGVYKWTDTMGQVHYGDKPTNASGAEEIRVDGKASSGIAVDDESRDEKRQRLLDVMQEDRHEKEQQREKDRADQEQRQRRCVSLKDRLRHIESATGLYRLDKDGNRIFLSNEGRKQSENNLRAQINHNCR
jgi:hypothetical protein